MEIAAASLTTVEVRQFHRNGYLGPFTACSVAEMEEVRTKIETEVLVTEGPNKKNPRQARHQDHRLVYDLITAPSIVGRAQSLLGDTVVIWASYFFNKEPGDRELPWHQDLNFWPTEPALSLSMWMAIDDVTAENACVQIIPGSHRKVLTHVRAREGMGFREEADPAEVDETKAIDMILKPGQFFLFNERLLHHSNSNHSTKRRLGLSARYTAPFVEILDPDDPPLFPGHACIVATGTDTFKLNRTAEAPALVSR